jgi:peptide-methionine (S)-S-oxide reductase
VSIPRTCGRGAALAGCVALLGVALGASCGARGNEETRQVSDQSNPAANPPAPENQPAETRLATFGGGCFWCVEAVFERIDGVLSAESGYAGGTVKNPTYEQVSTGRTGHAEVVQVRFDPQKVRYEELLDVFFKTHDPTTLNRQGADVGPQYRSVIFHHDDEQKAAAERAKRRLDEAKVFGRPIVTQIAPLPVFYRAEEYHQDYFRRNPDKAYCTAVIRPKIEKLQRDFSDKLKAEK